MKVPLTFISTAGALSNLGFNAYQQDTINDILDDLDSKKDLIDSIHNKGKRFIFVIEDIDYFPCIVILEKMHINEF